jgi:cytochrome P450
MRSAPGALPIVGNSLQLLRDPLAFLTRLETVADVTQIQLGTLRMALVTDADLTSIVLKDTATFDKGGVFFDRVRQLTGESLLTVTNRGHRRQRRLLQPAFTPRRIEGYMGIMAREIDSVLSGWRPSTVIDMRSEMYDVAARIAARTMFAADIARPAVARLTEALADYLEGLFIQMWTPPLIRRLPLVVNRRYRAALATLHDVVEEIIRAYRRSGSDHGDLLSMLLADASSGEGQALTAQEVHNQVITFFLAGIETTAAALTWTFYLLGRHPEDCTAAAEETRRALNGRMPEASDLPAFAALRRTVLEALRLYPPTWIFTRVTTREVRLGSTMIPQGMGVAYSPYLLQRSSENFSNPNAFRPGRWLAGAQGVLRRNAFVPFGDGAHRCIGESFAMSEIILVLATVLARWDVREEGGRQRDPLPRRATLTPGPLPMRLARAGAN